MYKFLRFSDHLNVQRRIRAEATGIVGVAPQPQNTKPLPEPAVPAKKAPVVERKFEIVGGGAVPSVEEFVPDNATLDTSFLEDTEQNLTTSKPAPDDSDR